ncbi:unnamed protein product [Plasmodium vivax]|uniref:(malaria parasite P. vivax) hypothetical protein n=1 Tax=Plasmodium vivax TaxID=5855 RepID=A0A8S4HAW0_PLAVI|nr:unnamed protein product [Plasmodium vivax]
MVDSKSYDAYLNYHDYDWYSLYFKRPWDNSFNEVEYQKSIKLLDVDQKEKDTHSEAFRLLFKYIHNSHVFSSMDPPTACKLISYALRNKVEKQKQQKYDDEVFDMFKNFVIKYKETQSISSPRCENSMILIDHDVFEKMHILYTLYEKFAVFAPTPHRYRQAKINCDVLEEFAVLYNDFIKDKRLINKSLYDVLKNFDERVTKTLKKHEGDCTGRKLTIVPFKAYHIQEEVKSSFSAPEKQKPIEVPPVESRSPINEQAVLPGTRSQITNVKTVLHTQPEMKEGRGAIRLGESEKEPESQEVAQRAEEYDTAERSHQIQSLSRYSRDIAIPETSTQRRFMGNSLDTQKTESPREDNGFFTNVQGAFSSIVQNVEPAPILGVSGGMGALFLLFKYTPVGSFFGGRRGRMHRIPNNFGEYYAGFAPGFAEQDYGNFGNERYNISYRPE